MNASLELSVILAIVVSAGAGALAGFVACRTMLLHRRIWAQTTLTLGYIALAIVSAVTFGLPLAPAYAAGPETVDAILVLQTGAIGALFPLLREFFAYASIDLRPGERVRIGELEGRVRYFVWTGVEIETEDGAIARIVPTWLMDKIITRYPA